MKRFGLIGSKLDHSFSPEIHRQLADYKYELISLRDEADMINFIKEGNFFALNVTMPYKEIVLPYLDMISPLAKKIGSVNTIINTEGIKKGFNTDYLGLKELIEIAECEVVGKKVMILGSGGSSKMAYQLLKDLGAREICVLSRSLKSGTKMYKEGLLEDLDSDIIINCTPVGMYPKEFGRSLIDIRKFKNLSAIFDLVYNPLRTQLMIDGEEIGVKTYGGLYMLIMQAFFAKEIFLDSYNSEENKTNKEDAIKLYKKILMEKKNIVLVGMPACGKTTIGKMLAKQLNRPFYDSDALIEDKTGHRIAEIIEVKGEEFFRNLEEEIISKLKTVTSSIIATGGGSLMRKTNLDGLKANGHLIFLDRPIKELRISSNRPLAKSHDDLKRMYENRIATYKKADTIINATGRSSSNLAREIVGEWESYFDN